ncbi:6429_t:CDS:2 [Funneliformis caledonium]|uniref:6429_t:CDS:1 n=1 Tax=Funneliformis caledonium TaxID=1117310 RepID=A0A9N8WFZ1_9GLOM|nr:6429_t:CDS:2 [Funneliformis caledonium]
MYSLLVSNFCDTVARDNLMGQLRDRRIGLSDLNEFTDKFSNDDDDNQSVELPAPEISIPDPHTPNQIVVSLVMVSRFIVRFKMTLISRWASALWLKENKRLKDAYQQFVRFNLENHQARLEISRDRLITARLLVAPYIVSSPVSSSSTPSTSDSVTPHYHYVNQPSPAPNLHVVHQQYL